MKNWFIRNWIEIIFASMVFISGMCTQYWVGRIPESKEIQTQPHTCPITISKLPVKNMNKKVVFQNLKSVKVHPNSTTKAYMDISSITNETSPQWEFLSEMDCVDIVKNEFGEEILSVNTEDGYIVDVDGYIGVALGTYFGDIGSKYLMELSGGKILKVVKVEIKADEHTDHIQFQHQNNGGVIEFVISTDKMKSKIEENGYVYSGDFNNNPEFSGNVVNIWKVN